MSDGARKRSRFDQTEPEPRRPSRFDRRSRSPSGHKSSSRRSRSPLDNSASKSPSTPGDPAAAAAAAAARINAQIQAKKGPQHSDAHAAGSPSTPGSNKPAGANGDNVNGEVYQQDGDFIKDIEVNDLRNRYTLTKGATQKMIKEETGADVTTRGNYYPDKSMATAANPPLYLHVTSQSKEGLDQAIKKIEELMEQELPNLIDERRFRRREPEQVERDELGRRKWPEEKIPVDLEPIPGFNLRANVIGHGGSYVKHIAGETGCRVQIKGRGSQFNEHGTNTESDEPMYLHVFGPDGEQVKRAKELCEDLLGEVRTQYQAFKDRGGTYNRQQNYQNNRGGQDYNGGGGGGGGGGGYHGHRNNSQQQHNQQQYGGYGQASNMGDPSTAGAMSPNAQQQADYAQQYAQYYGNAAAAAGASGGQDPYAAYGGYQNYVQMYYQYYAAAQAQQQQPQQGDDGQQQQQPPPPPPSAPGADAVYTGSATSAPPPPPPSEAPPPPPPPPSSGSPPGAGPGSYSAVPPPPGM